MDSDFFMPQPELNYEHASNKNWTIFLIFAGILIIGGLVSMAIVMKKSNKKPIVPNPVDRTSAKEKTAAVVEARSHGMLRNQPDRLTNIECDPSKKTYRGANHSRSKEPLTPFGGMNSDCAQYQTCVPHNDSTKGGLCKIIAPSAMPPLLDFNKIYSGQRCQKCEDCSKFSLNHEHGEGMEISRCEDGECVYHKNFMSWPGGWSLDRVFNPDLAVPEDNAHDPFVTLQKDSNDSVRPFFG